MDLSKVSWMIRYDGRSSRKSQQVFKYSGQILLENIDELSFFNLKLCQYSYSYFIRVTTNIPENYPLIDNLPMKLELIVLDNYYHIPAKRSTTFMSKNAIKSINRFLTSKNIQNNTIRDTIASISKKTFIPYILELIEIINSRTVTIRQMIFANK